MGLSLKNIFLVVGVYFLIRFISRIWKFRKAILSQRDAMMDQARQANRSQRQEGDIDVVSPKKSKPKNLDEGSYVDYEELD